MIAKGVFNGLKNRHLHVTVSEDQESRPHG